MPMLKSLDWWKVILHQNKEKTLSIIIFKKHMYHVKILVSTNEYNMKAWVGNGE